MSIKLKNDWKYAGDDRWDFELYLDSDDPHELDEVESVKYLLHPTFKSPVRVVDNSAGGFRLKSNGWGTFETRAFAYLKDGRKLKLSHDLELAYDPEVGSSK